MDRIVEEVLGLLRERRYIVTSCTCGDCSSGILSIMTTTGTDDGGCVHLDWIGSTEPRLLYCGREDKADAVCFLNHRSSTLTLDRKGLAVGLDGSVSRGGRLDKVHVVTVRNRESCRYEILK